MHASGQFLRHTYIYLSKPPRSVARCRLLVRLPGVFPEPLIRAGSRLFSTAMRAYDTVLFTPSHLHPSLATFSSASLSLAIRFADS